MIAARVLAPSKEALDTPLGPRGSHRAPGVCYSALRRLPRRDLHPLEQNSVKQTMPCPLRHDAPREKLIKARMSMLALAEELQNISLACKLAGISRSHFYEIKDAFAHSAMAWWSDRHRRSPGAKPHQQRITGDPRVSAELPAKYT